MNLSRILPDVEARNILLVAAFTLIEILQVLIVVVLIFSFIPIPVDKFIDNLFPLYQQTVKPEREMRFYHFFVFGGIAIQAGVLYFLRRKLSDQDLGRSLKNFILMEAFWLAIQLFAVFKIILYGNPAWARYVLYGAIGLSIASKVFWPEVRQWLGKIDEHYRDWVGGKAVDYGIVAAVCVFLIGAVYVVDVERILGMITVWGNLDQFHQWRQISVLKDLNDERFLRWMMTGTIIYFGLMFAFLRSWLKSALLAAGAMFLAVKWQLFHSGIAPIIWQYPQKIDPAFFIDLGLFALLLFGVRHDRKPLFCLAMLGLCFEGGRYIWSAVSAPDTIPLFVPLRGRNFFAFSWQFIIPVIYALTLLTQSLRREQKNMIVIAACLFGMAVFAGHIKDSTITNHYTHSLPLVMVFAFWIKELCDRLSAGRAVIFKGAWAFILFIALMTNNLFMVYPNIFNAGGINWEQVKAIYRAKAVKP